MKKLAPYALAAALAAATFLAGRSSAPAAAAPGGRTVVKWIDPMHPAYTSDKPGIAPDCGMQLEPVYADGGPAEAAPTRPAGSVELHAGVRQLQGIKLGTVQRAPATQVLRLFGRVAADETRVYTLNAAMDGNVRQLADVTTGSRVRKDQWLGSFFAPESRMVLQAFITALDVQALDAQARADQGLQVAAGTTAAGSAEYTVERLRAMGMTSAQIEHMRRTRELPLTIDLRAPVDGLVLSRTVALGQKFMAGAEWFRIANLDRVWVLVDAQEAEAALVRPGARLKVSVPGLRAELAAVASAVAPQFDPMSRTMKVRLEVENPGYLLRPDMAVDVELPVERPEALTVPADAVVDSGLRKTVFVERGDGWFEPRRVETGWRAGDRVEIVRGLAEGERIVAAGTFLVDSESQLKAAAAGVTGEPEVDPVCGMEVDQAKAKAAGKTARHDGRTFVFCSKQCQQAFQADPEKHLAHQHASL